MVRIWRSTAKCYLKCYLIAAIRGKNGTRLGSGNLGKPPIEWLSYAVRRVLDDWGSRGRRFKSCRPDFGKSLGNSDLQPHDETGAFRGNPVKCVLSAY